MFLITKQTKKLHPEANAVTLVGLFVDGCSTEHLVISACGN